MPIRTEFNRLRKLPEILHLRISPISPSRLHLNENTIGFTRGNFGIELAY